MTTEERGRGQGDREEQTMSSQQETLPAGRQRRGRGENEEEVMLWLNLSACILFISKGYMETATAHRMKINTDLNKEESQ